MSVSHDTCPVIHEGDSYILDLKIEETLVTITRIVVYPGNQNGPATEELFRDLRPETKRAIISQLNRRHSGLVIKT